MRPDFSVAGKDGRHNSWPGGTTLDIDVLYSAKGHRTALCRFGTNKRTGFSELGKPLGESDIDLIRDGRACIFNSLIEGLPGMEREHFSPL